MQLYDIQNVVFAYAGHPHSLEDISFSVLNGERLALLGANGSGKSTLLHLLDGLYFATTGEIRIWHELLTEEELMRTEFNHRFRSQVGFLFQNSDAQLFCATVEEELAFGPLQLRLSSTEIRQRIEDSLTLLQINHLRDRAPQTLSVGQKKMVALASVLILNPSVLLLDEPTAGLDPRSQGMLLEILEELSDRGMTIITATHDMDLLPRIADRALILSENHRLVANLPVSNCLANTELLVSVNLLMPNTEAIYKR